MRGAQVLRLVAALGLAGLGAAGCGDDTQAATDGPVDAAADRPMDARIDAPMEDAGPTHSVSIGVVEAHGIAGTQANQPVFGMVADVSISVTPVGFANDIPSASAPFGCVGNEFNLSAGDGGAPDLPPDNGDIGNITVSGYMGRGNTSTPNFPSMLTCTRGSSFPHAYDCMVPTTPTKPFIVEGVGSVMDAANFLSDGDMVTVAAAGGAAGAAFSKTVTAPPALTVSDTSAAALAGAHPNLPNAALTIDFTCPTNCGAVTVNLSSTDNPGGTPTHWAQITCSKIVSTTSGSITVDANYMQLIANNPTWAAIQTTVLRFGQPEVDFANARTIGAGQGQFFVTTHQ